jgi:hypothetical protein
MSEGFFEKCCLHGIAICRYENEIHISKHATHADVLIWDNNKVYPSTSDAIKAVSGYFETGELQ